MDEAIREIAVQKILDDRDKLLVERVALRRQMNDLRQKDMLLRRSIFDLAAAGRVFGQVVAIPPNESDYESIEALTEAMVSVRQGRTWEPGKCKPTKPTGSPPENTQLSEINKNPDETTNASFEVPIAGGEPRVRERVLAFLRSHYPNGARAADIKAYLKSAYGVETHEKTVGMTLYRLSLQKLVLREGRTWFLSPEAHETKNPDAEASGSNEESAK